MRDTARSSRQRAAAGWLWLVLALAGCDGEGPAPPAAQAPAGVPATRAEPATVAFEEVADAVGLRFRHFTGATGEWQFPEIMGSGVALLDYDGDGDLDVFLTQGTVLTPGKGVADARFPVPDGFRPGHRLFRNELIPSGRLRFTDVTDAAGLAGNGAYGMGAAVGDIDNDGDPDLYVTAYGPNALYRNEGDGTFSDITDLSGTGYPRWSASAAFLDYDRDGDLDLFVTNYVTYSPANNKACKGPLGRLDYCGPSSYEPLDDRLYRNEGDGRFTDVTEAAGVAAAAGSGLGVAAADFDADGWPDLYVANDGNPNQLWMNRGDGSFEDRALLAGAAFNAAGETEAGMGVAVGDPDRDGDEDIFLTHLAAETNTLYLNDGAAGFRDTTAQFDLAAPSLGLTGFGVEFLDHDRDGWPDLLVVNGAVKALDDRPDDPYPYTQQSQLLRNEGGQRFADLSARAGPALAVPAVGRGAAFGDLDNDGDVDVVVGNNNGPARLLLNVAAGDAHWLRLKLVGTVSNRDAIGARVVVELPGEPPRTGRAHRDGSYLSAGDPRVHVGLGHRTDVARITVTWPGGLVESWPVPGVDREMTLVEGSGAPVR